MADRMHAIPEDMDRFNADLGRFTFKPVPPMPAGVAGGMPEGAGLQAAMERAANAARDYLGNVERGFGNFRNIASACARDYNANDQASALRIAGTDFTTQPQRDGIVTAEQNEDRTMAPGQVD